jgi:hypothetical protein
MTEAEAVADNLLAKLGKPHKGKKRKCEFDAATSDCSDDDEPPKKAMKAMKAMKKVTKTTKKVTKKKPCKTAAPSMKPSGKPSAISKCVVPKSMKPSCKSISKGELAKLAYPGVPKKYVPPLAACAYRVYSDLNMGKWRVKKIGERPDKGFQWKVIMGFCFPACCNGVLLEASLLRGRPNSSMSLIGSECRCDFKISSPSELTVAGNVHD